MVASPSPGIIANPVPTDICPLPMSISIRPPASHDARMPAVTVGTDVNPGTITSQWIIKIRNGIYFNPCRKPDGSEGFRRAQVQANSSESEQENIMNQTSFHISAFQL